MTSGLKKSLALHLAVFLLWVIDVPMFWWNRPSIGQAPIIVDLKDVKISEMTNLPPKAKFGKEPIIIDVVIGDGSRKLC